MRRLTFAAVGLAVLIIILFNVQAWLVLQRTSRLLEDELGDRLQAVATTLAASLAGDPGVPASLRLLESARRQNGLFNVFAVDESLRYVANARDSASVGRGDAALDLDAAEVLAAFSGLATQSRLYAAGGYFLKTAYAPVEDSSGTVTAVVGAEADARFFAALAGFRRWLFVINALSLVAVVAVVAVSVSLARHALRLEQAAGRANTMALLGQMSAALAHDIRNPLGIIRAAAERLKRKYGQAGDPTFDYIPDEVERLNRILSSYLSLGARTPAEVEQVDVEELVAGVVTDLAHETKRSNVAVESGLGGLPLVAASRVGLRQVFLNLLLNAVQAQPNGGAVRVAGRVERGSGRDWLIVTVADSGPGIAPEHRGRLFEPFFTTKEKGSGLGLFSVRRTIEAHGGRVSVDCRPGAGTTVEMRLPV